MKKREMEQEIRRLREEVDQLKVADAMSKTTWVPMAYPPSGGTANPPFSYGPIWYVDPRYGIGPSTTTSGYSQVMGQATQPWTMRVVPSNRFVEDDGLSAIGVPA